MKKTLHLAIVGHANVGKTSLLRALARDIHFGQVSDKPGTTRHVELTQLTVSDDEQICFYDTPGFEDSIALYEYINQLTDGDRQDGIDRLNHFLASPEAQLQFEQEAKVIRQLLKSDAGLYVIDVREPVLAKYHDELAVLSESDKPILAILNFIGSEENYEEAWKKLLSRVGIHAMIRFDAVMPPIDGEARLYQSLSLLLEPAKLLLTHWLDNLTQQRQLRNEAADLIIAETLVDVTSYAVLAASEDKHMISQMQEQVRQREQRAISDLLVLYQFDPIVEDSRLLPLVQGRFVSDLFNLEAIKMVGIRLSKGVVSGALAGVGIDIAVGGITLGSAALIGATIGGLSQTLRHYGKKLKKNLSGYSKLSVDDVIVCYLSIRLIKLKESLAYRSHANFSPIILTNLDETLWQKGKIPKKLKSARAHPEWSSLNKGMKLHDERRQSVIENVASELA